MLNGDRLARFSHRGAHQRFERLELIGNCFEEHFRVPLDAKSEPAAWHRNCFHHAVSGDPFDLDPGRRRRDRLVMEGVDRDGLRVEDLGGQAPFDERDLVAWFVGGDRSFLLPVRQRTLDLIVDMLNKRASKGDIEYLDPAADAKYRKISFDRAVHQVELESIPFGADVICRRMDLGVAVKCWVDIGAATKDQPVDHIENRIGGPLLWRQDDGQTACGQHGFGIVSRNTVTRNRSIVLFFSHETSGDADNRGLGHPDGAFHLERKGSQVVLA